MTFSLLNIILLIVLGVTIALMLAPLQALTQWAGWWQAEDDVDDQTQLEPVSYDTEAAHFIVFLDGISKGSRRDLDEITDFLTALQAALPKARIISDMLPYSVFDLSLTDKRYPSSAFWSWVEKRQFSGNPIGFLVNVHNMFQVLVSADWRYGLSYNLGMAKLILQRLVQHGYEPHSGVPITIIGYSGGGQVAAGTASLVGKTLDVPVTVISIAGVMAGGINFEAIGTWYQVISNKDPVERLGAVAFPLRWRIIWFSSWNKAKRVGKAQLLHLDGARHNSQGGYMDKHERIGTDGSLLDRTVRLVQEIVLSKGTKA